MKVSIITATYNSSKTITKALASVVEQSYANIEHLIIDGGSTDATHNIVKAYMLKSKGDGIKWCSEPDEGIYDALNKGISLANGAIIGFVHSDDFLADNKVIERIVDAFKNQDCDGVYGDLHYVALRDTHKIVRNWVSQPFEPALLKKGWMPAHPTLYLKTAIYQNFGGFDTSYKIAADYDFILRIFKEKSLSFCYLPKVIVKMRVGGASNKNLQNIRLKMKEDYRAIKKNGIGGVGTLLIKNISKLRQFIK